MIEKFLPKSLRPEDKRLIALAVSAFVCPGAGQCMAGRWLIGLAFACGFVMSVSAFLIFFMWPPLTYVRAHLDEYIGGGSGYTVAPFQWRWILISFGCCCVLYCWNILDAWYQVRRAARQ